MLTGPFIDEQDCQYVQYSQQQSQDYCHTEQPSRLLKTNHHSSSGYTPASDYASKLLPLRLPMSGPAQNSSNLMHTATQFGTSGRPNWPTAGPTSTTDLPTPNGLLSLKPKRKGRRQQPVVPNTSARETTIEGVSAPRLFYCTVCPKSFKERHGWQRHESAVHHFHTTEWVCMWGGHVVHNSCAFCTETFPDPQHIHEHNIPRCLDSSPEERTFYRKDQLKQHIFQIHLADMEGLTRREFTIPASWGRAVDASSANPLSLWCGFCCREFLSTAERMDHVAEHFRAGEGRDWIPRFP